MSDPHNALGDENPFLAPDSPSEIPRSSTDPSVFAEPWMQNVIHVSSPDLPPGLAHDGESQLELDEQVWDEPGLSKALSGRSSGEGSVWYRAYLSRCQQTSAAWSVLVTLVVVIVSGPMAILGTLMQGIISSGLTMMVITGPTIEEVMKIAIPLWIVERRPWLFRSVTQILLCGVCAGLSFAAVENVMYLNVYVPNPSPGLVQWRWTVCVLLHSGCSLIASLGVAQIWRKIRLTQHRPDVSRGAGFLLAAVIIHGTYNAMAVFLEYTGFAF